MMHEGCKMNEKMKLKRKEKKKHLKQNATKQNEHDINLGMTQTQEHVMCTKRSKKT